MKARNELRSFSREIRSAWIRFRYQGAGRHITGLRMFFTCTIPRICMPRRWERLYPPWDKKWPVMLSLVTPYEEVTRGECAGDMIRVVGGQFVMGCSVDDVKSRHVVEVSSFQIGRCKITQREWMEYMDSNPSHFPGADLPVEQVAWDDAIEYCNRRSLEEELQPCYRFGRKNKVICDWQADGYRLPTEAEWRYVAGGGILFEPGYDDEKNPNRLGVQNLYGDLWELVWDYYGAPYTKKPQKDPRGPSSGDARVMLGGDPLGHPQIQEEPEFADGDLNDIICGFRVVRSRG